MSSTVHRPGSPRPGNSLSVTRGFAGRVGELRTLDALLAEEAPGTPFIAVIHGTAGVGKTTLALYWAHRLKDRYPDGQLHVNLRGFDVDQAPDPGQALDGLLQALGAAPESVPCELDAKAALFRSFLAGRRMLLVLDNARSAEFVRSLLPAAGGTLLIVTSRNQMDGLAVREGAHRLALGVLPYTKTRWPCWNGGSVRPGWPQRLRRPTNWWSCAPGWSALSAMLSWRTWSQSNGGGG